MNTRLKTLYEIYKIYTLLQLWNLVEKPWKALLESVLRTKHSSAFKNSAKFPQTFSHFCSFIHSGVWMFCNSGPKFCFISPGLMLFFGILAILIEFLHRRSKSLRCSNFLEFAKNIFEIFRILFSKNWKTKP